MTWRQGVLDSHLDAVHALVAELADQRHVPHGLATLFEDPLVARLQPQRREVVGEPADGWRIAAPVVVDDDHDRPARRGDVVQRLPAHPAGQRSVADDRDHVAVAMPGQLERLGQAVGVRQRRTGVAGLHPVMLAFAARRIARQAALLAQCVEVVAPARHHLVHVGLVARVEDDRVVRRVEHAMQRKRELHHTEIGAEMPAGCSDLMDQKFTDFLCQIAQLRLREVLQIGGTADLFKHQVSVRTGLRLSPVETRRCRAHRRGPRPQFRTDEFADRPRCGSTTRTKPVHLR
jgi:hypothetical protein